MTHSDEIFDAILRFVPHNKWVTVSQIYDFIKPHLHLDQEDFENSYGPKVTNKYEPKWKRNVRNVLQKKKGGGLIVWNSKKHLYKVM